MGVVKLLSTASSSPQLGTDSQTPLMVGRFIEGTAVVAPGFTKVSSSSSSHNFQKRLMARQRGGNISSCNNSSCHLQARQEGLGSLLQAPSKEPGWGLQRKGTVSALPGCLPCLAKLFLWFGTWQSFLGMAWSCGCTLHEWDVRMGYTGHFAPKHLGMPYISKNRVEIFWNMMGRMKRKGKKLRKTCIGKFSIFWAGSALGRERQRQQEGKEVLWE